MFHLFRYIKDKKKKNNYLTLTYLAVLFWAISYSAFEYFVPISLENVGYSFAMIGVLIATMSAFSIFSNFWFGYLQVSNTKRKLFFISLLFLMLSVIVFLGNHILLLAFLAMIIYGIGFDLFDITVYTSIYDNSSEENRSVNLSLRDIFENIGVIIGVVLSGILIYIYPNLLLAFILLFLIIAIIITSRYKNRVSKNKTKVFTTFVNDLKTIGFSRGLFALILIGLIAFWNGIFFAFEPLFIQNFQNEMINETVLGGLLLAVYVSPILFFEYLFGKLEDRIGRKKFALIGLFIASLSMLWLSSTTNIIYVFISTFLISTGIMAILNPAINGIYEKFAVNNIGKERNGDSVSFFELFANIGYITGPLVGGFLISKAGFSSSFRILGVIFIGLFFLSIFLIKD